MRYREQSNADRIDPVPREQLGQLRSDRGIGALAAGGRMVRDEFAPSWWTLADAAGNEADIASTKGRD